MQTYFHFFPRASCFIRTSSLCHFTFTYTGNPLLMFVLPRDWPAALASLSSTIFYTHFQCGLLLSPSVVKLYGTLSTHVGMQTNI